MTIKVIRKECTSDKIEDHEILFVGDTIYAESVVLEKRESKSRPYGGIVTAKTRGINQDGKTVIKRIEKFEADRKLTENYTLGRTSPKPRFISLQDLL